MKSKNRKYLAAVMFVVFGVIIGLVVSSNLGIQNIGYTAKDVKAQRPEISKESVDILTRTGRAMVEVVKAVKPAVVNISTTRTVRSRGRNPFMDDPFFRKFFGEQFNQGNVG